MTSTAALLPSLPKEMLLENLPSISVLQSTTLFTKPLPDESYIYQTPERKYYHYGNVRGKRSLALSEYWIRDDGSTIVPRQGRERIENEAASLHFVRKMTDIPVPNVLGEFEDDTGAYWLITEFIEGVDLMELPEEQKPVVYKQLNGFLEVLQKLKSATIGGPTGLVVPPYRVTHGTQQDVWRLKPSSEPCVFCHNDLNQGNVLVDPVSLKVTAVIDWEYAGFYPQYFESHFFLRVGPSAALKKFGEVNDTARLVEYLESSQCDHETEQVLV